MPGARFARVIVVLVFAVIVLSLVLSTVASPVGV